MGWIEYTCVFKYHVTDNINKLMQWKKYQTKKFISINVGNGKENKGKKNLVKY